MLNIKRVNFLPKAEAKLIFKIKKKKKSVKGLLINSLN